MKNIYYKHYNKKEQNYIILDSCYLQNNKGEWEEAIIYKALENNKKFCRLVSEWDLKFKMVRDE